MSKVATLLKGQEVGQFITEGLSEVLRKYAGTNERREASSESGLSVYTLDSIIVRRIPLTDRNYAGLAAVVNETIKKCKGTEADVEFLESLLQ